MYLPREDRHGFFYCFGRKIRKRSECLCSAPARRLLLIQEFSHAASRRCEVRASVYESEPLVLLLEPHSGEHIIRPEVFRPHIAEYAAVRCPAVAFSDAHAVDAELALGSGAYDHLASRAHAERIEAPSVRRPVIYPVVGRRQLAGVFLSVLRRVYERLRMLHPDAYRERRLLHAKAGVLYAMSLEELRRLEDGITVDRHEGIRSNAYRPLSFCTLS